MRQPVQFGKYLLLDRISVGGMAEVFKAKTFGVEGFEKVIAIKRILPSMGEDEDFISMFIDEAKIAGQLAHANIGQIHELGEVDGAHFIAMEYIQGRDLLQLQKRHNKLKKPISVAGSCHIMMKVCEGLHYAHKKRDVLGESLEIVHRDCSPQNVVISYEGEVKLIDFGIARAASRSSRTQAGVLKGKFAYMSPEQVRGLPLDRRSDIFSLGTILYECLTGERLFNAESDFSTLERVRNAEWDRNALKAAGIPPQVEAIVEKALSRNTADRYQWCSEMAADLRGYLQTVNSVYTSRSLGEDIRSVFAKERERDRELMDAYSKIGPSDGLDHEPELEIFVEGTGEARPYSHSQHSARPPQQSVASGSGPRPRTAEDDANDFDDGSTEVFGEEGMAELLRDMGVKKRKLVGVGATNARAKAPQAPSKPTVEVKDQKMSSAPALAPVDPQRAATKLGVTVPAVPAQALVSGVEAPRIQRPMPAPPTSPSGNLPGQGQAPHTTPSSGNLPFQGQAPHTPSGGSLPLQSQAAHAMGTAVPLQRSTTIAPESKGGKKSLLLGLAIAVVAGLIFYGVKTFVLDRSVVATEDSLATLQVMVEDKQGDVFLDGEKIGVVVPDEKLVIADLKPGTYHVKVEREGAEDCEESIEVTAERIRNYSCDTALKKATTLLFEDLLEGDIVVIDGKPIPAGSLQEPLPLYSGKLHSIAITRKGKIVDEFTITLEAGDQQVHRVLASNEAGKGNTKPIPDKKPPEEEPTIPDSEVEMEIEIDETMTPEKPEVKKEIAGTTKPIRKKPGRDLRGDVPTRKPKPISKDPPPKVEAAVTDTHGYLTAVTEPWARIFVDGKDTGKQTPVTVGAKIKLKPGMHKVTFVANGKKHNYSVTIKAGKTSRLVKMLSP